MSIMESKKMSLGKAIEYIEFELLAQAEGRVKQIPTIAGRPGIGKTESLRALAEKLGYSLIVVQLSAVAPEEFSGIPEFVDATIVEDAESWSINGIKGAKFTRWSIPELVTIANTTAKTAKNGVIVLFDDIHACDPALERYLFNLFLDKTVGQYKLSDNVLCCAAMNDSDEAGFVGFNSAVLDRLAIYSVEFDFDYWYGIIGYKLNPIISSFLKSYKEMCFLEESTDTVTPSPRSWTELSNLIDFISEKKIDFHKSLRNIAAARVGDKAASELNKHNIIFQKFNFEDIVKNKWSTYEVPEDIIEQALCGEIVRYIKTEKDAEHVYDILLRNVKKSSFASAFLVELSYIYRSQKNYKHIAKLGELVTTSEDEFINNTFIDAFSNS